MEPEAFNKLYHLYMKCGTLDWSDLHAALTMLGLGAHIETAATAMRKHTEELLTADIETKKRELKEFLASIKPR